MSFFDEVQYLEHNTVPQISTETHVLEPEVVSISDQVQPPLPSTRTSVQTTLQIRLYIPSPILSSNTTRIRRVVPCQLICRGIRDRSANSRVKIWCTLFLYLLPTGFVGISIFVYLSNGIINIIQNRAFFAPNTAIEALHTPGQYIENEINTKLIPLDTFSNFGIYLLNMALRCILLLNIACLGIPYTPTLFQQKFTLFVQPYIQPFIIKTSYTLFWRILGAYLVTWLSRNYAQYQRK